MIFPHCPFFRAVGESDPGSLLSIYVDALTALTVDQGTQKGSPFPSVTVLYLNKTGDFCMTCTMLFAMFYTSFIK
jgi:hypothetical protein